MYGNASEADAGEESRALALAALLALYVLVCLVGILGNVSLMVALSGAGAARLRTPQMLSACAADLLVCAASAPLAASRAARPYPLATACHLAYYIESFPVAASTLSLVAVAADRCGVVRRGGTSQPARARWGCSRPVLTVLLVWTAALLLSAGAVTAACAAWPALAALHAVLTFLAPVAAVARCHWAVRVKLTALSLTARAAHGELPLPVPLMRRPTHVIIVAGVGPRPRRDAVDVGDARAKRRPQPSLLGPQPATSTLRSRRRLGNVLMGAALLFGLCWVPHAALALSAAGGLRPPRLAAHYLLLLGHAHSALAALAYWLLNRHALAAACAAWRPALRARDERPSSTNEAALGAFHPRLARPAPAPRPPPSSFLY